MKIYRLFGAAFLAAALWSGFTSCSDKEDDPIVLDPTVKTTIVDDVMAYTSDPINKRSLPGLNIIEHITAPEAPLSQIVVNEDLSAVLYIKGNTRAMDSNVFVTTYKIEGDKLIIDGGRFGDIIIDINSLASISMGDNTYSSDPTEIPVPSTSGAAYLCRKWGNTKYTAGVKFDKIPVWGTTDKEKQEVDNIVTLRNNVLNTLVGKGSGLTNIDFQILRNNLVSADFKANNKVYFYYSNGSVEESSWTWINEKEGSFKTTLDGVNVNVDVRYKAGTPNTAYFIIDANLSGIGGLGVHSLNGRLICKMTD